MSTIREMHRSAEESRRTASQLRRGLLRLGTVHSVDDSAGTVVVDYGQDDAAGQPLRSYPMPWLQRSTEHRPPLVGDHALVLDPSLGNGGAVAFPGWPSEARPPVEGGGPGHVLYSGDQSALIKSDATEVRASPDAVTITSDDVTVTADAVTLASDGVLIGADDATEALVLGTALKTKLDQIHAWLTALNAILTGPPIAEPGMGSPSALQTAIGVAVAATPLPTDLEGTLSTKHFVKD